MTSIPFSVFLLLTASLIACSHTPTFIPTKPPAHQNQTINRPTATSNSMLQFLKTPGKPHQFEPAPERNLYRLTEELVPSSRLTSQTKTRELAAHSVGQSETFWLIDLYRPRTYQSDFTLALVTPNAYWYVEDDLDISMSGLERSAKHFEEEIYPIITRIFGTEWIPGIDNDPRLNVLNAKLKNTAGYFNSADEYPTRVKPQSNEREIIYINAHDVSPGTANYDLILSHELQHAIHWNADHSEDTWVNEGLSELASSIALGSTFSIGQFLISQPTSLIHWPMSPSSNIANYGAASLFMHFFVEHYGGRNSIKDFLAEPGDSIQGINRYLKHKGYGVDFKSVFRQWTAANILDEHPKAEDKLLRYEDLEIKVEISETIDGLKNRRSEIPQYSVEYTELQSISEPFQLSFQGDRQVALLPIEIGHSGCWWSNSGDSIDSTIFRNLGEQTDPTASLEYEVWFETEEHWDYVYIEISVDGGELWKIIETPLTSSDDPFGNAYGPGYTGKSGGWLSDSVDLAPFAGEDISVRFQYVTDDAVNASGACFRNISIADDEITFDDDWYPKGFSFINNVVVQDFQIQLITTGDAPRVRQLPLSANNTGRWEVQPPNDGEELIVAIGAIAEKTREFADYSLSLETAANIGKQKLADDYRIGK